MFDRPLVLGTAGHVDHGKTSLVHRLTGHDTDRLAAEKLRGISIELGFAPWRAPCGRLVSFVDVPGHERFVRHMIAGASGIDAFLLCIAADDGVKPQTMEHLEILRMLRVRAGVVAVTRVDVASPAAVRAVAAAADRLLDGSSEIVAVSSVTGQGVPQLVAALNRLASELELRPARPGPARLFVDRCFSRAGAGTVVTGTIWGAGFQVGQAVAVYPSGRRGRVRGLQVHDRSVPRARRGRVAIAIAGIGREHAGRGGCVVGADDAWEPTRRVAVALEVAQRSDAELRSGMRLRVFLGTVEGWGRLTLLEGGRLGSRGRGLGVLHLEQECLARVGDLIILRHPARATVASGQVLDAHPRPLPRSEAAAELAHVRGLGMTDPELLRLRHAGAEGLPAHEFGASAATVLAGRAFEEPVVSRATETLMAAIPRTGLMLRVAIAKIALPGSAGAALIDRLVSTGRLTSVDGRLFIPIPTCGRLHRQLTQVLTRAGAAGRRARVLASDIGASPPSTLQALQDLQSRGEVHHLEPYWFASEAVRAAVAAAVADLAHGALTLAQLRDNWSNSRDAALALAEFMDRLGLTVLEGSKRHLVGGTGGLGEADLLQLKDGCPVTSPTNVATSSAGT